MLPWRRCRINGDAVVVILHNVFNHDDRITALRNRVPGVHNNVLLRTQHNWRRFGGTEGVFRIHRNPIHGTGGIMRRTNRRMNSRRRHAPAGIMNGNHFPNARKAVAFQFIHIILTCLLQRHIC